MKNDLKDLSNPKKFHNSISIKNEDAETVKDNIIYTANLCKNGNNNQNFYLTNDNDNTFVDSDLNIYDNIESDHIHFHRHSYDLQHSELENIHDI